MSDGSLSQNEINALICRADEFNNELGCGRSSEINNDQKVKCRFKEMTADEVAADIGESMLELNEILQDDGENELTEEQKALLDGIEGFHDPAMEESVPSNASEEPNKEFKKYGYNEPGQLKKSGAYPIVYGPNTKNTFVMRGYAVSGLLPTPENIQHIR